MEINDLHKAIPNFQEREQNRERTTGGTREKPRKISKINDLHKPVQKYQEMERNTDHPSNNVSGKVEALPRCLVADVSNILSIGWEDFSRWSSSKKFSEAFRTELATMLLQIGIAWAAVLAGDIDDIREHVQEEFLARLNLRSEEIK